MAVTNPKKTTRLNRGSLLELPADLDRKKYKYRWIAKAKLDQATDGFEPRGYQVHRIAEGPNAGKHIGRGDLILAYKTSEEALADKEYLHDLAQSKISKALEKEKQADAELAFEVKKAGGKLKFEYGEE